MTSRIVGRPSGKPVAATSDASSGPSAGSTPRPRAQAPSISAADLWQAATAYVARYAASREKVRGVLQRRIERRRRAGAEIGENVPQLIDATVERLVTLGLVDDRAFAAGRARLAARRGESERQLSARLARAGIDRQTQREAIVQARAEAGIESAQEGELVAAFRYARRRRLGPYRSEARAERRLRDIAALVRAGFAYDIARRVIDHVDADPLD